MIKRFLCVCCVMMCICTFSCGFDARVHLESGVVPEDGVRLDTAFTAEEFLKNVNYKSYICTNAALQHYNLDEATSDKLFGFMAYLNSQDRTVIGTIDRTSELAKDEALVCGYDMVRACTLSPDILSFFPCPAVPLESLDEWMFPWPKGASALQLWEINPTLHSISVSVAREFLSDYIEAETFFYIVCLSLSSDESDKQEVLQWNSFVKESEKDVSLALGVYYLLVYEGGFGKLPEGEEPPDTIPWGDLQTDKDTA